MVFRQRRQLCQLAERQRLVQVLLDVVHQAPAQVRCQAALEFQALALADLGQQHMVDHRVGQAAGQQAFARLVPVQRYQLAELRSQLRVFEEGAFAQLQLARLAVEQGDGAGGEALGADIQVRQADVAVDHPG